MAHLASHFIAKRVRSKSALATLTEHVRTTHQTFDKASSVVLQLLTRSLNSTDPLVLVDVVPTNSATTTTTTVEVTVKYQRSTSSVHQEATLSLPSTVLSTFQEHQSKLYDLQEKQTKAKVLLSTDLLPILQNAASFSDEFQGWGNKNVEPKHVIVSSISGAMTNVIYKCELQDLTNPTQIDITAHPVLVRLYGDGTDAFFDRSEELAVFTSLSMLGYGSHGLLCCFENGRCERFFEGCRPLYCHELIHKKSINIGKKNYF